MSLTRIERETIINFNEEEQMAELYTASEIVCRRMKKRGFVPVEVFTMDGEECGWVFEFPKRSVFLPRNPLSMSREKRLSLIARGKALSEHRKAKNSV